MDTAIAKRQGDLKTLLLRSQSSLAAILPKHLNPERMVRVALMATVHQPKLLECSAQSILLAVMQAAQLGLEIGGAMGLAYLVPFKGIAQFIPGYRGLIHLARQSGEVWGMDARAVFKGDEFRYQYGLYPELMHKPKEEENAELTHAYCVARLRSGSEFDVMDRPAIDRIRARSRAANNGPWVTDFDEMAKKTVVRRIAKMLPMSVQLAAAVEADNRSEGVVAAQNELLDLPVPELEATPPQPEEDASTMSVKEKIQAKAAEAREAKQ